MSKRPSITKAIILEAAQQIAPLVDGDAETIAEHYRHGMDGYELARQLDKYAGWDLRMTDVEELDGMQSIVDSIHAKAEQAWFEEIKPEPPLPIGSLITKGEITGIYAHGAARYLVKENGCTNDGRRLIIKFEDAVLRAQP